MSASPSPLRQTRQLRSDLDFVTPESSSRRFRVVIDEVSGRFTRVAEHVWQALVSGNADDSTWRQARAAGWTRQSGDQRSATTRSLLSIQIPLGSADAIAKALVGCSAILFSPIAVAFWCGVIAISFIYVAGNAGRFAASLESLPTFLATTGPFGLAACFVMTKIVHELGHAVACRRAGSRCGDVGVLLLCGMPCPYCDVTDIYRQTSPWRRATVMAAGIYVEWILAAIATMVWALSVDPALRMHAINVMLVCGVSTFVFNANPLMRYDGYFLLSDMIGSVNLRAEARESFTQAVMPWLAGQGFLPKQRLGARARMLAIYHAMSLAYRVFVSIAIAAMLIAVADWFSARPIAIACITMVAGAALVRQSKRVLGAMRGRGRWGRVPRPRRVLLGLACVALPTLILFVPLPRHRAVSGIVDAADAETVFVATDGLVTHVPLEFGDEVDSGMRLASIEDVSLEIELASLNGNLRLAQSRSRLARRGTLDRNETSENWETHQAVEDALHGQLVSLQKRIDKADLTAPVQGIVLPSVPPNTAETPLSCLVDRKGTLARSRDPWCRISKTGKLFAVLTIDAGDRREIQTGTPVRIAMPRRPGGTIASQVLTVSAIEPDEDSVVRNAAYRVLCPLPTVPRSQVLGYTGTACRAVFCLPNQTIAQRFGRWAEQWIGG